MVLILLVRQGLLLLPTQALTSLVELSLRVTTFLLVARLRVKAAIFKYEVLSMITVVAREQEVWVVLSVKVSGAGATSSLALVVLALHLLDLRLGANILVLKLGNLITHLVKLPQLMLEALLLGYELCVLLVATTEQLRVVRNEVALPTACANTARYHRSTTLIYNCICCNCCGLHGGPHHFMVDQEANTLGRLLSHVPVLARLRNELFKLMTLCSRLVRFIFKWT